MADRAKVLRVALSRPHRYRRYRRLTMALTLAILFAVPLAGVARVDLWGGTHRLLAEPVPAATGLAGVLAAIAAFYAATLLINIVAGRLFCGFGCPVGQLSRFADVVDAYAGGSRERRRAWAQLLAFAAALSTAVVLWWVSPVVLLSGEALATIATIAAVGGLTALAVLHARFWRWGFCRKLCPIGLYYSVVQTEGVVAIEFDRHAACYDCGACAAICPAQLDPRRLDQLLASPGGLAFSDLPASSHCLRCGACVDICEHMMRKRPGPPAMAFRRPRRGDGETDAAFSPPATAPTPEVP